MTISADQGSKVIVQEINLSQVITSASTSVVAQVVVSDQGLPTPVQFTNAQDYLAAYGNPNAAISMDVYCGLDYFSEGNNLWGLRCVGANAAYSAVLLSSNIATGAVALTPIPEGITDPTNINWNSLVTTPTGAPTPIAVFYAGNGQGSYGNSLGIQIVSANLGQVTNVITTTAQLASGSTAPGLPAGTYQYQVSNVGSNGEALASSIVIQTIAGPQANNYVTISWPYAPNATSYNVYGNSSTNYGLIETMGQVPLSATVNLTNSQGQTIVDSTGTPIQFVQWIDNGSLTPNTAKQPITSAADLPTPIQTFGVNVFNSSVNTSTPVESFNVSYYDNTDSTGLETELEQRLNPFSQYIQVVSNVPAESVDGNITPPMSNAGPAYMQGGDSGDVPTDYDIAAAWSTFADKQLYAINILLNSGHSTPTVQLAMDSLAQSRGDCVALMDVPSASQQFQQAINYRNLNLNLNSTYSALFNPDVLEADLINGKQQYVPFSGWAAALCARTDRVANPSFSIAGLNRGLVNVLSTRYTYDQGEMDSMFQAQVNYTQTFVGQGIALWEQQTLAAQFSALSWLSVRRIVNVMKTALYQFLLYSLQEPNDDFTGRQIVASCSDYLQSIQNARGISSFTVISDSSNNTAQDFNSGIRNVTVIIVPVIPIHIINLQVVVSQQGVSFQEALSQVQPG
jgi:phage tail sheath protein FI